MRIALACPYAWDAAGGVQVHVGDLARRLIDRGHDVVVLAPSGSPASEPWVTVVGRSFRFRYAGTVAPICPSLSSRRRVRAALRGFEPDLVHVHEPFTPSASMFAALASSVPVVATFHAYLERSVLQRAVRPLASVISRSISIGIAVSNAAAEFAGRVTDLPMRIIPNGVETERFRAAAAPRRGTANTIAWVGRLDPQKGFPVFLEAFSRMAPHRPDLRAVIAGAGTDTSALDRLDADVRGRLSLLGAVPNSDLPPVLHGADVFAAPATGQESFGIVLVEAMAAGVPVVASDIAGYREVVRAGESGLLVPPGDAAALAVALGKVLDDRALADHLSAGGSARAEDFSWDSVLPRVEDAYAEALGGRA